MWIDLDECVYNYNYVEVKFVRQISYPLQMVQVWVTLFFDIDDLEHQPILFCQA